MRSVNKVRPPSSQCIELAKTFTFDRSLFTFFQHRQTVHMAFGVQLRF